MRVENTAGAPVLVAQFDLPDGSTLTLGESAEQAQAREEEAQQASKRRRTKKADTPEESDTPD
jgi:hypothetical protein